MCGNCLCYPIGGGNWGGNDFSSKIVWSNRTKWHEEEVGEEEEAEVEVEDEEDEEEKVKKKKHENNKTKKKK